MPLSKRLFFRKPKPAESCSELSISSVDQTSLSSGDEEEPDPLLALFRVHNTNRVKFDLSTGETNDKRIREGSNKGVFNIKKFVGSSLFSSNTTSVLHKESSLHSEEEDDILQKMLDPPSPLFGRVSSFFVRNGNTNYSTLKQSGIRESELEKCRLESKTQPSKERIAIYLRKAQRHHKKSYRYRPAMKYYLLALKEMQLAGYDDTDPLPTKVLKALNDVHHAQSTLTNSANIVKMGIQHEDKNQLVKALKMYTVAYRMRRDSLGVDHPSLPVLLNMMGSVQVKRGEFGEAMQIYELGLRGRPEENGGAGRKTNAFRDQNPLTTSVTLRDMGMILEHLGEEEKALRFYHASLKYSLKYKKRREEVLMKHAVYDEIGGEEDSGNALEDDVSEEATRRGSSKSFVGDQDSADPFLANIHCHVDEPFSLDEVRMVKCTSIDKISATATDSTQATSGEQPVVADCESGEMELFIEKRFDRWALSQETAVNTTKTVKFYYDELFVGESAKVASPKRSIEEDDAVERNEGEGADLDIAMTLHQIGQIHRRSHRHAAALSAYNAALRGMKHVFGCDHAHTAAILGNIGNLYMETGDYDEAFAIYQEVLGIETLHLGLSHPEVSVSLHNIATIESSRGNFSEAVSLYKQVAEMQKIRFGQNHITVAITLGCLADAYERMGNLENAMKTYEEALKIRTLTLTKYHIDVGRLMHKLGRLASSRKDYATAMNHVKKAIEIYAINVLPSDHLFMKEMARDYADIQAGLAFESTWIPYLNDNIDSVCDC
jgi:tetratricopeptide (TPR) repeat protein